MASANVMSHTVGGNLSSQLNAYGVAVVPLRREHRLVHRNVAVDLRPSDLQRLDEQLLASGADPERPFQLHRRRTRLSVVESQDLRVGGVRRDDRPHPSRRTGDGRLAVRRRRALDLERLRPAPPDPHGRAARLRRPVPDQLRDVGAPPEQHHADVPQPRQQIATAGPTRIRVRATDRRGNVGAWSSESRIWVP